MNRGGRGALPARAVAAGLLCASLLPIANWIPSERSAPWYESALRGWLGGGAILVTAALLIAAASYRWPALWREGALREAFAALDPARPRGLLLVSVLATGGYLLIAALVFDRRPLLIDELVMTFQARGYASGRLWLPVDPDPAFRTTLNLVEHAGRWFGHFPPGWPAFLAVGELARAGWVAGPVAGGLTVTAFGLVLRRADARPAVRAGALLLFALAPFTLFMAGSRMSHGPALGLGLAALAAWLGFLERPRAGLALAAGLALGLLVATRPAEGLAFGLPGAVWVLAWARRERRWTPLLPLGLGVVGPVMVMLAVNAATTGSPFVSGYSLLWGGNVGLGFHAAPYGPAHTPLRGAELISLYLLRLNVYLFEAPVPGLLAAGVALLLSGRWHAVDRFLLAMAATTLLVYFGYWHDGFFLGPRFAYPLVPVVALWTARFPAVVASRAGDGMPRRAAAVGLAAAVATALASGIPVRIGAVSEAQPAMRFDPDRAAAAAGVQDAVVFVRESWGAQLLARLAALGVSRPAAERYYRAIDSCVLDGALGRVEDAAAALDPVSILEPLTADSARLIRSPFSPDTSERTLDGARYDARCMARISEDRAGITLLAPTLLSRRTDLLFVRDLHRRNRRLLADYPDRRLYLLLQRPGDAVPRFAPVDRDSLLAAP